MMISSTRKFAGPKIGVMYLKTPILFPLANQTYLDYLDYLDVSELIMYYSVFDY